MNRMPSTRIAATEELPELIIGPDRSISRQQLWHEIKSPFLDWVEDRLESEGSAEAFLCQIKTSINN